MMENAYPEHRPVELSPRGTFAQLGDIRLRFRPTGEICAAWENTSHGKVRIRNITYNYKYKHQSDHDVTLGGYSPYGCRHVVPSTVSLAGVYASPANPALAGVLALPAPTDRRSRLSVDTGRKASSCNNAVLYSIQYIQY